LLTAKVAVQRERAWQALQAVLETSLHAPAMLGMSLHLHYFL